MAEADGFFKEISYSRLIWGIAGSAQEAARTLHTYSLHCIEPLFGPSRRVLCTPTLYRPQLAAPIHPESLGPALCWAVLTCSLHKVQVYGC